MNKNRVLGKGLSALIQGADLKGAPLPDPESSAVYKVPLNEIGFNPDQPRKSFDDSTLEELADSIRQVGVLQPVLLRKLRSGEKAGPHPMNPEGAAALGYGVVAGERRVRAARMAGLAVVPAIICTYEETEALKVALLENIQREDLGPVEEATAFFRLLEAYGATQEELAVMLGKKRSTVANTLRLLSLEQEILDLLQEGKITRGHAKAILGMPAGPARVKLARLCHSRGLSVRDCENRAGAGQPGAGARRKPRKSVAATPKQDPAIKALQERSEEVYGSPVVIDHDPGTGKGTIQLRYYSDSDLIRLLKIMGVDTNL